MSLFSELMIKEGKPFISIYNPLTVSDCIYVQFEEPYRTEFLARITRNIDAQK
jgi:hypothetical protein